MEVGAGQRHRLAGRHHRIEDGERVLAEEAQPLGLGRLRHGELGDPRRQEAQEEERPGLVAIVALNFIERWRWLKKKGKG